MKAMKAMKKVLVSRGAKGKFTKRDFQASIKIKGKSYDKMMIEAAKIATKGAGDGRISSKDAAMIIKAARPSKDGRSTYGKGEKATMAYVRANFKFTAAGDKALRKGMASLGAKQGTRTKAKKAAMKAVMKTVMKKK